MSILPFDRSRCRPPSGARKGRPEPVADITLARAVDLDRCEVYMQLAAYDNGTGRLIWTGETMIRTGKGGPRRHDAVIAAQLRAMADAWDPRPSSARALRSRRGRR